MANICRKCSHGQLGGGCTLHNSPTYFKTDKDIQKMNYDCFSSRENDLLNIVDRLFGRDEYAEVYEEELCEIEQDAKWIISLDEMREKEFEELDEDRY